MPQQVVDVNLRSETGAIGRRTYSDLLVVAREPDIADPTYNEPRVYDSSASVAGDFGSDSDAYIASQQIEARGANQWWVVMLDTETHSEVVGTSDEEATDNGDLQNVPLRGDTESVSVTVEGTDKEVVPSTNSPPDKPDTTQVAINFDTGEVVAGESSSGDLGIEIDYETLTWDAAFPDMTASNFDIAVLANTRADRSYVGELDELLQWSETNNCSMVVAYENGNHYEDDDAAMEAAHEIGAYIPSGHVLPVAHKSANDVASGIAGRLATKQPWFNPYMDGAADYSFNMDEYRRSKIGGPEQPGTFEGGNEDGAGPANVLHTEMGVQILSNSLSTAGESSNYQFFDIGRTEEFVVKEARFALRSLALRRESIPFAPLGRTLIENALRKTLNPYVASSGRALSQDEIQQLRQSLQQSSGSGGEPAGNIRDQIIPENRATNDEANVPLSELEIHVPDYDDLSQQDRANRQWSGIQITAQISGSAHTFSVDLAVTV